MKTRKEVDDLKAQWKADPCWDIWNTEGFEQYKDELYTFQERVEKEWHDAEVARLAAKAADLKCSVELVQRIERLERDVEKSLALIDRLFSNAGRE
jgi:hypothetical protein